MPTQWTLSIMPEQGWIPREWSIFLAVGVIVVEALIFGLAFALGSPFDVRVGFMPKPCVATTRRGCSPIARSSTSSNAPPARDEGRSVDDRLSYGGRVSSMRPLSLGPAARRSYLESVKGEIDEVSRFNTWLRA